MFEHANADLVQVFEETIEDRHQISCCQLVSQDNGQLVDGESQRTPHLPLQHTRIKAPVVNKQCLGKRKKLLCCFLNRKTTTYWFINMY